MKEKYLRFLLFALLFCLGGISGYLIGIPSRNKQFQMGFESGQEFSEPCNPLDYCGEIEDNCWREVEMLCSTLD